MITDVIFYSIQINYWIDGEQQEQNALFKIIHNQTSTGLILGLRENTYYQINVQAINTAGNGPKSENYRTRTLRAGDFICLEKYLHFECVASVSWTMRWKLQFFIDLKKLIKLNFYISDIFYLQTLVFLYLIFDQKIILCVLQCFFFSNISVT